MACIGRQRFSTEPPLGEPVHETRHGLRGSVDQQAFSANLLLRSVSRSDGPTNRGRNETNTPDVFCATTNSFAKIPRLGHEPRPREAPSGENDKEAAAESHTHTRASNTLAFTPQATAEEQPSISRRSPVLPRLDPSDCESPDRAATRVESAAAVRPVDVGLLPVDSYDVPVDTPELSRLRHERAMLVAQRHPPPQTSLYPFCPGRSVTQDGPASVGLSYLSRKRYPPSYTGNPIRESFIECGDVELDHNQEDYESDDDPDSDHEGPVDLAGEFSGPQGPATARSLRPEEIQKDEDVLVQRLQQWRLDSPSRSTASPSIESIEYGLEQLTPSTQPCSQPTPKAHREESFTEKRTRFQTPAPVSPIAGGEQTLSVTHSFKRPFARRSILQYALERRSSNSLTRYVDERDHNLEYNEAWIVESVDQQRPPKLPSSREADKREREPAIARILGVREADFLRLGVVPDSICNTAEELLSEPRPSFREAELEETIETKFKACLRCRFQKQKCLVDESNPDGPCLPCKNFSKTSRKTIHRTPCFRKKISDVVLHRRGGLGLTRRWQGTELKNIHQKPPDGKTLVIAFTSDVCEVPIEVEVMRFKPRRGDITKRYWTIVQEDELIHQGRELAPYCLVNVHKAAADFEDYIDKHWSSAFIHHSTNCLINRGESPSTDDGVDVTVEESSQDETFNSKSLRSDESVAKPNFIEKTHRVAFKHFMDLPDKVKEDEKSNMMPNKEKQILQALFKLWFANRHTRGSSYICSKETLGMAPSYEPGYPLPGKVSLPRMILAQFDSITYSKGLHVHAAIFIREMEVLMGRNHKKYWFTTYISLFVLLSEASWLTRDRYRHARQLYGHSVRYSIPSFVEELQEGCNILLMHWHYYNCRPYPNPEKPQEKQNSFLADLTPMQYNLVMDTIQRPEIQRHLEIFRKERENNGEVASPPPPQQEHYAREYRGSQSTMDWDEPYYWVSQMFEEDWRPHKTYMREKEPQRAPPDLEDSDEDDSDENSAFSEEESQQVKDEGSEAEHDSSDESSNESYAESPGISPTSAGSERTDTSDFTTDTRDGLS